MRTLPCPEDVVGQDLDVALVVVLTVLRQRDFVPSDCLDLIRSHMKNGESLDAVDALLKLFNNYTLFDGDEELLALLRVVLIHVKRFSEALFSSWDVACKRQAHFPGTMTRVYRRHEAWDFVKICNENLDKVQDRQLDFNDNQSLLVPLFRLPSLYDKAYVDGQQSSMHIGENKFKEDAEAEIQTVVNALHDANVSRKDLKEVQVYLRRGKYMSALYALNLLFERNSIHSSEEELVLLLLKPWNSLLEYWRLKSIRHVVPDDKCGCNVLRCKEGWYLVKSWEKYFVTQRKAQHENDGKQCFTGNAQ